MFPMANEILWVNTKDIWEWQAVSKGN